MSKYANLETGKGFIAAKGPARPDAGIWENVSVTHVGIDVDKEGNATPTRGAISFEDANGRKFSYKFFDTTMDWAIQKNHKVLEHLASTVMSVEQFAEVVQKATSDDSFETYMNTIGNAIMKLAKGQTFNVKLIYDKKGFLTLAVSDYSRYIENTNVKPMTLFMSAKDWEKAKKPTPTPADQNEGGEASTGTDDLPF